MNEQVEHNGRYYDYNHLLALMSEWEVDCLVADVGLASPQTTWDAYVRMDPYRAQLLVYRTRRMHMATR